MSYPRSGSPTDSAKTTLHVYGHMWPDADESTRSAIDAWDREAGGLG
ncbi:hypothetical protein [Rhodococcus globerulus]